MSRDIYELTRQVGLVRDTRIDEQQDNANVNFGGSGTVSTGDAESKDRADLAGSDKLLQVAEVADYLRVSQSLVYKMIERREIPAIRIGRLLRVDRDALDEALQIRRHRRRRPDREPRRQARYALEPDTQGQPAQDRRLDALGPARMPGRRGRMRNRHRRANAQEGPLGCRGGRGGFRAIGSTSHNRFDQQGLPQGGPAFVQDSAWVKRCLIPCRLARP